MRKRNPGRRLLAALMSAAMTVTMLPFVGSVSAEKTEAAPVAYKTVAGLSTSVIKAPKAGTEGAAWTGSYVWYGKYNGEPVKYRVLDPSTNLYSTNGAYSMLLDCDSVLYKAAFDVDSVNANSSNPNTWLGSDLRLNLNGNDFLFKNGVFTEQERNAIMVSKIASHSLVQGTSAWNVSSWTKGIFKNYVPITSERIFLLDAEDASNSYYGYNYSDAAMTGRLKKYNGVTADYWLRSASANSEKNVAIIRNSDGAISSANVTSSSVGVSPVMNIDNKSVLFSSVVSGEAGQDNAEYRLTIIDPNMFASLQPGTSLTAGSSNVIYVPYILSGANASMATRITVMVLDKEYRPGNTNKANILHYEWTTPGTFSSAVAFRGINSFVLPSNLDIRDWGTNYHVYLMAEDINELYESDYSSEPEELPAPKTAAGVSTNMIIGPVIGSEDNAWGGSYVWYGKYEGDPVRYRVLAPNTDKYGSSTMLLDCDYILYYAPFDKDGKPNAGATKQNQWAYSDMKAGLNGSAFLTRSSGFTTIERNLITSSKSAGHTLTVGTGSGHVSSWTKSTFENYTALTGEKIFLLDSEDVSNTMYGYHFCEDSVLSRTKIELPQTPQDDKLASWWLRSDYAHYDTNAGYIYEASAIEYTDVIGTDIGVSPAFNVDRSMVVLSSLVSGKQGYPGANYKLTLQDNNITLGMQPNKMLSLFGSEGAYGIQIPFTLSGTNASKVTNISVLILDKEYKPGNTNNAKVLLYRDAYSGGADGIPVSGYATVHLPADLPLGGINQNYFVYLLAEDINGIHESDYTSEPMRVPSPGNIPPVISSQPQDVRTTAGTIADFTVVATGSAPLSYQWQSRKDAYSAWTNSGQPGAKSATLHVTTTQGLHRWQFRCIVTDVNGASTPSLPATLRIIPKITKQPQNARVQVGDTAYFTVAATGKAPLKYQWQSRKDANSAWTNSAMPGAKTPTLEVTATVGLHKWQFRCVVTDANGESWGSSPATLRVAPKFTKQPKSTFAVPGTEAVFTVTAIGKATLKYQWQSRKDANSAWTNSSMPGAKTATLRVPATLGLNGWQFRCVVTDGNGESWGSAAATLFTKLGILKHPQSTTVSAGSMAKFTIEAYGKEPLTYQWQSRKDANSAWTNSGQSGAKSTTLSVKATAGLNGWQFRCIVKDADGNTVVSKVAILTVK